MEEVANVDEKYVAPGAAGNESVGACNAFTKVTQLDESGVVKRLNLAKC
jgi:hypothetical protein